MRGSRLGVIAPRSPFGTRVRELLSEGRLPVIELKLFEVGLTGEASLTQFGDDVVVTQPLDPDVLPHLDAVFLSGEDNDALNRVARETADAGVLTFIHAAVDLDAPVLDASKTASGSDGKLFIVPRLAAYLLGTTLGRLAEKNLLRRAAATVLLPASESGPPGAAELHEQVVHLLNFKTPPTEVLKEQLAFNLRLLGPGESSPLAEAVAYEASRIAGLDDGILTASLVQVPVFHGYAASIRVELAVPAEPKSVSARFRSAPFDAPGKSRRAATAPTPVGVSESEKIHLAAVRRSGEGFWLWVVADSTAYDPAAAAVEAVKARL